MHGEPPHDMTSLHVQRAAGVDQRFQERLQLGQPLLGLAADQRELPADVVRRLSALRPASRELEARA